MGNDVLRKTLLKPLLATTKYLAIVRNAELAAYNNRFTCQYTLSSGRSLERLQGDSEQVL
jgi:hypothetical protein